MAESIMTQITMAGGAINLGFNEVLMSWFSNKANGELLGIQRATINSYDWSCLIVYHPRVINPFVAFRSSNIMSQIHYETISGSTPTGTEIGLCILNNGTDFYVCGGSTLLLLA